MSFFSFLFKKKKDKPELKNTNSEHNRKPEPITRSLENNIKKLKDIFNYPQNKDLVIRELSIKCLKKSAFLIYMIGMANEDVIIRHILHPLMEDERPDGKEPSLIKQIITAKEAIETELFQDLIDAILMGKSVLLIEDYPKAILVATTKFEHRPVEKTVRENVIRGPQEAFTEAGSVNRSLIRKRLRDENLVSEILTVGERSLSEVSVMYIRDLADPKLVEAVKKRIQEIQVDTVQSIEILEQHIEERPYSLIPSALYSERPDRAVAFLQEGHIVLLMDSSADCLIVPVTFWSLVHTSEDMYQRWPYGNALRLIRLVALFAAVFTPAIYVGVTTYHAEMVPTDLLLAITATRERVPFPVVVEVLLMEISFELLREAGVRIPTPIGPTIGIVGALILGQAAVEANIVSPILIIVVAITGLSSFAMPDNSLSYMVRIMKFVFLLVSAFMGIYGVTAVLAIILSFMVSSKSFEVPFLAPYAPDYPSSRDLILRPPIWKQWLRPFHVKPQDSIRKKPPKGRSNQ